MDRMPFISTLKDGALDECSEADLLDLPAGRADPKGDGGLVGRRLGLGLAPAGRREGEQQDGGGRAQ